MLLSIVIAMDKDKKIGHCTMFTSSCELKSKMQKSWSAALQGSGRCFLGTLHNSLWLSLRFTLKMNFFSYLEGERTVVVKGGVIRLSLVWTYSG